jgi:RHH-type transcriptional regulator, proline utilization regulon repressor / proline dehydrogenase / delta 1-pyrroline-5-carboxylate dehydrogenase
MSRARILAAYRSPEPECVPPLVEAARLSPPQAGRVRDLATKLVVGLREKRNRGSGVDALMKEFSLSSQEGVALMCMAEALLRIPDKDNVDRLIRDKLAKGDWRSHVGSSPSMFVNAATWGLLITGKLVATSSDEGLSTALTRLVARGGEPLIRKGVDLAMRLLGEQFVTGQTIEEALERARSLEARGYRYSFDMLGEAASTQSDARAYMDGYVHAIHAIGRANRGRGLYDGAGISVKLSALHPRYTYAQRARVMGELLPRLRTLTLLAREHDIGLNIDAEEAERLDPSLDLLESLLRDPAFDGWNGIGFVVQAYQKRAPFVLDHLIELARETRHRVMVRLVKGAYWDSEIKRAQVDGLEGYPVFTRKAYTDVSYLACARKLLASRDTTFPQFATHNAHTLAAIYELAGSSFKVGDYEFQCLHGMGETLYDQVVGTENLDRPCRIYAPVGTHETLLAYLVRRLLENGANTSFVSRIVDADVSIEELVADPVEAAASLGGTPHGQIALPRNLFPDRDNSHGLDLSNAAVRGALEERIELSRAHQYTAQPMLGEPPSPAGPTLLIRNPANRGDTVGSVVESDEATVDAALAAAQAVASRWAATTPESRAALLERAAGMLEANREELIALAVREAGKTMANGVGEVREAADFLRYYAAQARSFNLKQHVPLGPVACISPWNFPLAIFIGQVSAALAAGNPVLAKPAEQTPLIAGFAVRLLHRAGIPVNVLQFLPGRGEIVGARLVADARVKGVVFTGSTEVAGAIQRSLAERGGAAFIAETGGQNCMIVDSTALAEQVVADALSSAFDSAGQRCSALRVLCLQEEIADKVLAMLKGAMAELIVGDPSRIETDVGPVIDIEAQRTIDAHIEAMPARNRHQVDATASITRGTFVAPTLIEIDSIAQLEREVFGPVLHVVRFRREGLAQLVDDINATGYGLTLGIQSRIDETVDEIVRRAHVGNTYVNRNIVGAVVGVQPFGGEGLSGTGPKAGGPLYLHRLLRQSPGPQLAGEVNGERLAPLRRLLEWLGTWDASILTEAQRSSILYRLAQYARDTPLARRIEFVGPVGEDNSLSFAPRGVLLGSARSTAVAMHQLGAALATGNRLLLEDDAQCRALREAIPAALHEWLPESADALAEGVGAALFEDEGERTAGLAQAWRLRLALREGPIVQIVHAAPGYNLERLVVERTLSVNTTAAGGNTHLMTLAV